MKDIECRNAACIANICRTKHLPRGKIKVQKYPKNPATLRCVNPSVHNKFLLDICSGVDCVKHTQWCEDQEYCKNCEYGCEVVALSSDVTASSVSCDLCVVECMM